MSKKWNDKVFWTEVKWKHNISKLGDVAKVLLNANNIYLITLNNYITTEGRSQINDLNFHLKKLKRTN